MITDYRIERKFTLGINNSDFFKKILITNSFHRPHNDREVSSVYLDTYDYNFFKDNIDGIGRRKKIRIRWYDNDLNKIFLEEKIKNNFLVLKKTSPINIDYSNNLKKDLINFLKNNDYKYFINSNLQIVLKTNYKRSYWLSSDKKIRATIDINLNTSSFKYFGNSIYLPETVLEFKYLPENEIYFRNFFNNIKSGLRFVKYSKYVKSFLELNHSGLLS